MKFCPIVSTFEIQPSAQDVTSNMQINFAPYVQVDRVTRNPNHPNPNNERKVFLLQAWLGLGLGTR